MKKRNCLLFVLSYFMFIFFGFSQEKAIWKAIDKNVVSKSLLNTNTSILSYKTFRLELSELKNRLEIASKKNSFNFVEFPNMEGELLKFKISESSVLHPNLAHKFPYLKTYKGQSIDKTKSTIYFSITPIGLYAMIFSPNRGVVYIDPYTKDKNTYMVYLKTEIDDKQPFECLTPSNTIQNINKKAVKNGNDLKLRTFRLAVATTEEYSNYHINAAGIGVNGTRIDSITAVLAAIVTTITRVNAVFERDVALTMQLVTNNDQLIFLETDPGDDPYTNDNKPAMLTQNQTTLDNIIGSVNYDIGHVFSSGGGGIAYRGSVCGGGKAGGVTGSSIPEGVFFDIDYVSHEMGHQFGANHTFNSTSNNCGNNNRNANTAVEPGSGSTIMGYAGICAPENIQSHSHSYFHSVSITEIINNITTGNSQCAIQTNFTTNLHVPIASAGDNYTIPKSTPFVLKGQGTDIDGNQLTYSWEQTDNGINGIQSPPSSTQNQGAVFRSIPPHLSPNRYLPSLPSVILGGSPTWEVLPNVSRTLNFNFTVRDNVPGEGQTDTDTMTVTVNDAAGPFVITSQDSQNISWTPSDTEMITWDVAGTNANGINVDNVNILLSLDGGITFSEILATNTPNDGQEQIIVPSSSAPNVRVMVEAIDNIFYAVNAQPFSIGSFTTTCTTYNANNLPLNIPDNNPTGIESTINIADDFNITDANVMINVSHTWIRDLQIYLKAPNGTEVLLYDRSCGDSNTARVNINAVFDDASSTTVCENSNPAISGTTKADNLLSIFNTSSSFGEWKLKVIDNANQDSGTLNNWSLELCETLQTVGIEDFSLDKIQIFPNPFSNTLHLTIPNFSINSIQLLLYDMSGRLVYSDFVSHSERNSTKKLSLSNLSSGIYILHVKHGSQRISKKIIKY